MHRNGRCECRRKDMLQVNGNEADPVCCYALRNSFFTPTRSSRQLSRKTSTNRTICQSSQSGGSSSISTACTAVSSTVISSLALFQRTGMNRRLSIARYRKSAIADQSCRCCTCAAVARDKQCIERNIDHRRECCGQERRNRPFFKQIYAFLEARQAVEACADCQNRDEGPADVVAGYRKDHHCKLGAHDTA